jgi:hypothetical protein
MMDGFTHINPWIAMGLWDISIWALVMAGIVTLTHHHE